VKFRPFFFWFHLSLGLTGGLVVLFLSFTGLLLTFEPQILVRAESSFQSVAVAAGNPSKISLDDLASRTKGDRVDVAVTGFTIFADPRHSTMVQLGRNETVYIDPYTGVVLGSGAKGLRDFFETVTSLHRWFGFEGPARETAKMVKGIVTILFGFSVLTGFYLWWPKHWTLNVFKVIGVPQARFSGKQREFNWHNAFGFWAAPWLLIIIVTGLIMIYPWANDLLYRMTGNEPPIRPAIGEKGPGAAKDKLGDKAQAEKGGHTHHKAKMAAMASFDTYLAAAVKQDPQWISINLRLPQGNRPNVMAVIEDPSSPNAYGRSLLTLDVHTAEVLKWEPYEGYNLGRKARIWVRALHTGEAGGLIGQLLAAFAVLSAMLLCWTGFSLAYRRFFPEGS
jgi:uncharacterized iron-regulated membrane protein